MKTTLPTLSYKPTGFLWSEDVHSSTYTTTRAYPRTDLENFVRWDTFEAEIDRANATHMFAKSIPSGTEYDIGSLPKKRSLVRCEEAVRYQAKVQLHDLVVEVLDILGIEGLFDLPDSGNNQIIGAPDFSWLRASQGCGQVEYKTKWAAPLKDLPAYFQRNAHKIVQERQSIDAVFQLYGYMTFNENKYDILNNMEYAWFFQRVETAESQGKTLRYYGPINLMLIQVIRQVCSKLLWAPFCLPKAQLPFIVPQPLPKFTPADTSVHLAHLFVAVMQPLSRTVVPFSPRGRIISGFAT
ncbi:hypothetical protein APHAL10511_007907 [Amanita phalloides]|nr:hypothetical protein APHAL10511_007907 [Amanita phalloides]